MASTITIGTAPDSWGVWFPSDPEQVPASTFLREVAEAGYEAIELGPYGYLPTDPAELRAELDRYGLSVLAGTVFSRLHQPDSWDFTWRQVTDVAALTRAVGGEHVVVIPAMYRDEKTGAQLESPDLTAEQWERLTAQTDELGRRVREEYGLALQFHPHAESHVGYQPDVERFLESTDPAAVNLCLDTGHISYCDGNNVEIIERFPERITYVHLKQVDPEVRERVRREQLSLAEAVPLGVMCEPPFGEPDMPELLGALAALDREIFTVVEQDLYPVEPHIPLPIQARTAGYFRACGLGPVRRWPY